MRTINTSGKVNQGRRQFLRTAAITVGATQFGIIGSAAAQTGGARPANLPTIKPGTNTSFGTRKQIDAGVLTVGYAEAVPPMALRSFCCTAGPTTSTAMSTLRRC